MNKELKIALPIFEKKDHENYFSALEHLGAHGFIVDENVNVEEYDGLLLPGGVDVNPKYYNQEIDGSEEIDDKLDTLQFAVIDKFAKANKPILGICRGHQLINVYYGGSLIQDLSNANEHVRINGIDNINEVAVDKDSFLYELYKSEKIVTNSSHHQAIDRLANGFKIVAKCDDVVEAIEHQSLPVISVQFHPERMCFEKTNPKTADGSYVIKYFLDKCK